MLCPKEIFLTFMFYNDDVNEKAFRIYILLHIKKHYILFYLFLKSLKVSSVAFSLGTIWTWAVAKKLLNLWPVLRLNPQLSCLLKKSVHNFYYFGSNDFFLSFHQRQHQFFSQFHQKIHHQDENLFILTHFWDWFCMYYINVF